MGAWGVGMQSNDSALDAIGTLEGTRKKGTIVLDKLLAEPVNEYNPHHEVFGVAECLLDRGIILDPVTIKKINARIKNAMTVKRLKTWTDPDERKAALQRFKDRLNGKKVDQEEVELDNLGLLTQLGLQGKTRAQIKKIIRATKKKAGV